MPLVFTTMAALTQMEDRQVLANNAPKVSVAQRQPRHYAPQENGQRLAKARAKTALMVCTAIPRRPQRDAQLVSTIAETLAP